MIILRNTRIGKLQKESTPKSFSVLKFNINRKPSGVVIILVKELRSWKRFYTPIPNLKITILLQNV